MSKRTIDVIVTQFVRVTIDESKFDEAFMEEFRESFYPFETIEEHAEHIAQLSAREMFDFHNPKEFVEGYGPIGEMGIRATVMSTDTEAQ